jgi:AcrR family transcriptional regulator
MSRIVQEHRLDRERGRGTNRSIDRRVARTRTTLHHALISLVLKKGYDSITIEEICEAANVGRSTFYAHFTSKDDLHQRGVEHLRQVLTDRRKDDPDRPGAGRGPTLAFSRTFFEHAQERKDLFRALAGSRGGAVALATIRQIISEAVREELAAVAVRSASETVPRELVVQYTAGAFMAVLTWWLEKGAKLPAERIDAAFRRLALEGIIGTRAAEACRDRRG